MSIRARMAAVVALSALFTAGLLALFVLTVNMNQRADACLEQARDISDAVLDLGLLTGDFTAAPTARAAAQWNAAYRELGLAIEGADPCIRVSFTLEDVTAPPYERLGALFDEQSNTVDRAADSQVAWPDPYSVHLTDQMRVEVQLIAGQAIRYRQEIATGQQRQRERIAALAVLLAIASVVFITAAGISVWRFLAEPLARLRDGARILAAGDLEHRFNITTSGEFGDVARAFDDMAEALAASSRALRSEIAERRTAEEEVRRSKRDVDDVVERRTAQLVEANARLEEATAAKDRFMARMSHELRTPLNSIIGFSSVLASGVPGPLTEEQQTQLRMISNSGKRLLSLVNDLLDISVISAGGVEFEYQEVDLESLCTHAVGEIAAEATAKGLDIECDVSSAGSVISDGRRLEQVLLNLLGNAVKFTERGEVRLAVTRLEDGAAQITVSDTGMGIDPERLEEIFTEFAQLSPPSDHVTEGTGLGLAIARNLTEMLGGTLTAQSVPGSGSTFTVTVPERAPARAVPRHSV